MKSSISPRKLFMAASKKYKAQSGTDQNGIGDCPAGEASNSEPQTPSLTSSKSLPVIRRSSFSMRPSVNRRKSKPCRKLADNDVAEAANDPQPTSLGQPSDPAASSLHSSSTSSNLSTDSGSVVPDDSSTSLPTAGSRTPSPPLAPAIALTSPAESTHFEAYIRHLEQGIVYGDYCSPLPIPFTCILGIPCPPRLSRRLYSYRWFLIVIFALLGANAAGIVLLLVRAFEDMLASAEGSWAMRLTRLELIAFLITITFCLFVTIVFWTQVNWAHGKRSSTMLFPFRLLFA